MKSKKTIVRELRSLMGLMRLGLLLAAMVLTAGCSGGSDDDPGSPGSGSGSVTPEENQTPISFTALQDEKQDVTRAGLSVPGATRAAKPLEEDAGVTTFKVWGYKNTSYVEETYSFGSEQKVFPGFIVKYTPSSANTTTTNSDGWEYVGLDGAGDQTIKYWDFGAKAYRFFGVAPATAGITPHEDHENHVMKISFQADATAPESCPYYSRLWFSDGNPVLYPTRQFGKAVQLEFLKPFATVMFKFIPADDTVNLNDLSLENFSFAPFIDGNKIATAGNFTVIYPLTSEGDNGTKESYDVTGSTSISAFEVPGQEYNVLPVPVDMGVAFKLLVTVNGNDKEVYVPAKYMEWRPLFNYTYIFKVNEEGGVELGQVTAAYTAWEPGSAEDKDRVVFNW